MAQKMLINLKYKKYFLMVNGMDPKNIERRAGPLMADRRSCRRQGCSSFINFRHLGIGGRRKYARRKEDNKNYYVDYYHAPIIFFMVLAIILMNILDAYFTLFLLDQGNIIELNPLMAALIKKGSLYFFNVKYLLTSLSLLFLVIHKNFTFCRAMKPTYVIFFIFSVFLSLNTYQIYLLIS
jgi:hypothetical protein